MDDPISEAVSRMAHDRLDGLDMVIAESLIRRDIPVPSTEPGTFNIQDMADAIKSLHPPILLIHPQDMAVCQEAAERNGYTLVEEWMASRDVHVEIVVSPYVWPGQMLISNPSLGADFADS